ncbi:hypothetical protein MBLNU457_3945t1 [Dothideomycetes sp. NU457]
MAFNKAVKGSCMCGDFAFEFTGQPKAKIVCHCIPCRKSSGTTGSYNLWIPSSSFTIKKGIPKLFTRQGDSGSNVTYSNCPICSNLIYVESDAMPDVKLVKMGLIDDREFLEELGKPGMEIYCKNVCAWEEGWEGTERKDAAP